MDISLSKILVKLDRVCDYVPVLSTLTNLVDLFQKHVIHSFLKENKIEKNRYYKHIKNKKDTRALTLLFPALGNIIIAYKDHKKKRAGLVEKTPSSQIPKTPSSKAPSSQISPSKLTAKNKISEHPISKIDNLKKQLMKKLLEFETYAKNNTWNKFATDHYDWWMFPINRSSLGHGDLYNVSLEEIEALRQDKEFMQKYRRGVELVVNSWGWDLHNEKPIDPRREGQQWTGYGIRLLKMSSSLKLFGEIDLHKKLTTFFYHPSIQQVPLQDIKLKKPLTESFSSTP